ncbi:MULTISPECIES: hypothetical protein [Bacteria]|uniref:hypothetical protein n=1 Tax=Bacteria TaxID=2 RepID=UPI003C7E30C7
MTMDIRQAVLAEVEEKIASGEALRDAIRDQEHAQEALARAAGRVSEARKMAMKSGWSEAELKRLNLVPGTRATRSRSSRKSRPTSQESHEQSE